MRSSGVNYSYTLYTSIDFLFILKNTATCVHSCSVSLCMHACACANINSVYDISDWSVHMPHFQSSQCCDDPSDLEPPHTRQQAVGE